MSRKDDGISMFELLIGMSVFAIVALGLMHMYLTSAMLVDETSLAQDGSSFMQQTVSEVMATKAEGYTAWVTPTDDVWQPGPPPHAGNNGNRYGWDLGTGKPHETYEGTPVVGNDNDNDYGTPPSPPGGSSEVAFTDIDAVIAKYLRDPPVEMSYVRDAGTPKALMYQTQVILHLKEDEVPIVLGADMPIGETDATVGNMDLNGDGDIQSITYDKVLNDKFPVVVLPVEVRMNWDGPTGTSTTSTFLLLNRSGGGQ